MIASTRLVLICAAFALLSSAAASAAEVEGVAVAERVQIGPTGAKLVLNGAGVRTRFIFKIYVAALYLPAKLHDGEAILRNDQPRRLQMHMLRYLTSRELTDSMNEALNETLTPAERSQLESRMQQFNAILATLQDVKRGTRIAVDYVPNSGTIVLMNGDEKGRIPGADFNQALLRMWIGALPRDADLRTALLGIGPDSK